MSDLYSTTPFSVTSSNLCAIFASLKSTNVAMLFLVAAIWVYLHSILHSELRKEATFGKFVCYSHLESVKVIEISTNRKPVCNFLLVFHCNCVLVFYCFRDITISVKNREFLYPVFSAAV